MRTFAAVVLAALVLVPAAAAKEVTSIVLVGVHGSSVELSARGRLFQRLTYGGFVVKPGHGGYLLVYPQMAMGMGAQPGRYYPQTHAYCASWTLATRVCLRVDDPVVRRRFAVHLPRLRTAPTRLVSLERNGSLLSQMQEVGVVFDAVFARKARWQRSLQPRACSLRYSARWDGPESGSRPARFCLSPRGVWAHGSLFPLDRAYYDFARANGY
jgi:hypothetical protein